MPFSISQRVDNPISLYAATKKSTELIAECYSHLFEIQCRTKILYSVWAMRRPDITFILPKYFRK